MTLRECPLCLVEVADGKTTVCPFCGGKLPPAQGASNGNGWPRPVPETPRHAAPQASPAFDAGPIRRAFDARRIDVAADILERTRDVLGGRAGRLKRGTVLVLDVQGSEPGEVSAFVSESLAALARRGGLPAGLAGDAVAVVFGAPVAFDHDTQSALHAALEVRLQASMAPAGGASPFIRIGIATGPIHIEGTGDLSRFAGDALDAATELQHRAPMGGILLCDDTRRAAGSTVATLPVPGVTLPDGTGAWFLVEENGTPGVHGGRGEAPFCGRQEELGRLLAFLAGDSSAGVMHVVGEGGIGKSRLVREALARRPGLAVATWRAVDGGSAVLGGPILGWLREWMGLRDDTPPATLHGALGRLLRERFPTALSGAVLIEYLFGLPQAVALLAGMPADRIVTNLSALLRDMLVHLAGPGGSCVVVAEDIHRHDPVTRQVLQALGDGIGEGLLVVVTYRPGGEVPLEQRTRHEVLNLAPLQAAERSELLSALLPTSEFPAEIRRAILSKAAGNPLFLEELGRLLRSGDATDALLAGDDSRNRIAEVIPVTLAELIRARMDRLDARTRHVLQCMSVLGLEFSVNALGLFDGIADQLSEQLHFLRVAGYIDHLPDPNGLRYFFVHGRLQEEAYASLRSDQREALHQRIARRLEGWLGDRLPTYFEELAWHFEQGGEPERASYYLVKAGDRRAGLGAGAGALESYRQATRLLEEQVATTPRSTLMARLLLRSARLHRDRGENDLADEMIASALILATNLENPHLVLEVRLEEAMSGVWKGGEGGQEAALSGLAEDARRLGHGSAELAAQNALGVRLLRAGRHEEALEVLQKVARLAEQQDVPHLLADAFNNAGLVYWRWGELQQALRAFRKALPLRRRTEDRSGLAATLMNMGIIHEQLGEVKAAVTSYRKSGDLARSVGHVQALAAVECNLSNLARRTGGLIGALEHAILSVRFSREVGDRNFESMAAENAGLALMELGRYPEARQQFSAALGLAHDVGNEEQEIATRLSLAELGLREGAEAAAVLGDCEEVARLVEERKYHDLLPRAMRLKGLAMEATASADSGPRSLECLEGACERARSQGNVFETLEAVRALMRWAEHHRETEKAGSYRREVESLMGLVEVSWE